MQLDHRPEPGFELFSEGHDHSLATDAVKRKRSEDHAKSETRSTGHPAGKNSKNFGKTVSKKSGPRAETRRAKTQDAMSETERLFELASRVRNKRISLPTKAVRDYDLDEIRELAKSDDEYQSSDQWSPGRSSNSANVSFSQISKLED